MKTFLRASRLAGLILLPIVLGLFGPGIIGFAAYLFKEGQPFRDYRVNNAIARKLDFLLPEKYFYAVIVCGVLVAAIETALIWKLKRRRAHL